MSLTEELAKLREALAERAGLGDQLESKREMEHFVSFRSLREATEATTHFEEAGWQVDADIAQDQHSRFPLRVYRIQRIDVEHAENALRAVHSIALKHGGSYDGFGAVFIEADGTEPRGFFGRLFGNP